jgi:cob(I)alamin adenosyltransferase
MELILTGRYMCDELAEYADLISDIREIKHHFQTGTSARKGIEY